MERVCKRVRERVMDRVAQVPQEDIVRVYVMEKVVAQGMHIEQPVMQ